jgi:RNA polymerase-binding transcription factor DksA
VTADGPPDADAALSGTGAELDAVEAALVRLDDGSFDRCEVCGASIGSDRLLADPLLTRCPAHTPATG